MSVVDVLEGAMVLQLALKAIYDKSDAETLKLIKKINKAKGLPKKKQPKTPCLASVRMATWPRRADGQTGKVTRLATVHLGTYVEDGRPVPPEDEFDTLSLARRKRVAH